MNDIQLEVHWQGLVSLIVGGAADTIVGAVGGCVWWFKWRR